MTMLIKSKILRVFNLKRDNKVITFVKHNPAVVALAVGVAIGVFMPEVYAKELDFLGTKLKKKIDAIADVMTMVGGAGCAIGFLWLVFGFLRGEPNYRLAGSLLVGGGMLTIASRIAQWISA